jgi:hypothetical protein
MQLAMMPEMLSDAVDVDAVINNLPFYFSSISPRQIVQ